MDSINISVPDEMQDDVNNWQNGGQYKVTIEQQSSGQFNLVSIDGEGIDNDEGSPTPDDIAPATGTMNDTTGTTVPTKNPAVAAIMAMRQK